MFGDAILKGISFIRAADCAERLLRALPAAQDPPETRDQTANIVTQEGPRDPKEVIEEECNYHC